MAGKPLGDVQILRQLLDRWIGATSDIAAELPAEPDVAVGKIIPVGQQVLESPEAVSLKNTQRRRPERDAAAVARLINRIESVLAAAKTLRGTKAGADLSAEAVAEQLANSSKDHGFKTNTLRQIIRGTYPPMKTHGIKSPN